MTGTSAKTLRKITIKTVFGKVLVEELLKAADKRMDVMDVYGIATAAKTGESDYGSYCKFIGQFKAVNLSTGEIFRAAVLLLPRFLEDELQGLLGSGASSAEFAVRISAVFDEEVATKYVYVAEPILPPQESAMLADLESRIMKQLESPEKAAKSKKAA